MFDIEKEKKKMGRPRKFTDPDEMYRVGLEYIEECIKNKEPLKVTGLALALDTFKDVLLDYESGKYDEEGKNFSAPVKRLKQIVESGYEDLLFTGKPTGGIFGLKNFGWKDEQTQIIENRNKEMTPADEEEILKKYGLK